jgi:hypothetical protein
MRRRTRNAARRAPTLYGENMKMALDDTTRSSSDGQQSLRYPRQLLRRVSELTGFSYRLSALDLSNDGGELAVELARLARTVTVAVDDEASFALTSQTFQEHQSRVQLRFHDLAQMAAEEARYWLVTIGRPLHRRDGASLLANLEPLVERGGAVAVLGFRYPRLPVNAWREALAVDRSDPVHDLDEGLLLASTFARVERVSVFTECAVTVDHAYKKLQRGNPELTPGALREHASEDGLIHALLEGHALIARREGDRSGRWS